MPLIYIIKAQISKTKPIATLCPSSKGASPSQDPLLKSNIEIDINGFKIHTGLYL